MFSSVSIVDESDEVHDKSSKINFEFKLELGRATRGCFKESRIEKPSKIETDQQFQELSESDDSESDARADVASLIVSASKELVLPMCELESTAGGGKAERFAAGGGAAPAEEDVDLSPLRLRWRAVEWLPMRLQCSHQNHLSPSRL